MTDKKDEEISGLLQQFGYTRVTAKIITYLLNHKKSISKNVEREMDIRQPEASIAFAQLLKDGVVSKKEIRGTGKGRPAILYIMNGTPETFFKDVEKRAQERIRVQESLIVKLQDCIEQSIK